MAEGAEKRGSSGEALEHNEERASTCGQQARLNAVRLSLAERWRRALGDLPESELKSEPRSEPVGSADLGSSGGNRALRDEFWEAREMTEVWAQAQRDPALLAMLREDEDEALGEEPLEPLDEATLRRARESFHSRLQSHAGEARPAIIRQDAAQANTQIAGASTDGPAHPLEEATFAPSEAEADVVSETEI